MRLVVVCYYNGIRHGLRDQVILIIFDSKYDPEGSQRYRMLVAKRFALTESQFSLPDDDNNRQCA